MNVKTFKWDIEYSRLLFKKWSKESKLRLTSMFANTQMSMIPTRFQFRSFHNLDLQLPKHNLEGIVKVYLVILGSKHNTKIHILT